MLDRSIAVIAPSQMGRGFRGWTRISSHASQSEKPQIAQIDADFIAIITPSPRRAEPLGPSNGHRGGEWSRPRLLAVCPRDVDLAAATNLMVGPAPRRTPQGREVGWGSPHLQRRSSDLCCVKPVQMVTVGTNDSDRTHPGGTPAPQPGSGLLRDSCLVSLSPSIRHWRHRRHRRAPVGPVFRGRPSVRSWLPR